MVLGDEIVQAARQVKFASQFQPIRHVADDGFSTDFGCQVIMGIDLAGGLVFNKEKRVG